MADTRQGQPVQIGERITEQRSAHDDAPGHHLADIVTAFCGSTPFLLGNGVVFAVWIALNTLTPWTFDRYPFSFLTFFVSIEAIFLSLFILASQTRQADRDRQNMLHDIAVSEQTEREAKEVRALLEETKHKIELVYVILEEQMVKKWEV